MNKFFLINDIYNYMKYGNVFYSFILVIILDTFKCTFSVLFGTHILAEGSTRVMQLPLPVSKLTNDKSIINNMSIKCILFFTCTMIDWEVISSTIYHTMGQPLASVLKVHMLWNSIQRHIHKNNHWAVSYMIP